MTGPNSLTMDSPTIAPIASWVPYLASSAPVCRASTMPIKSAIRAAIGRVPMPTTFIWREMVGQLRGASLK